MSHTIEAVFDGSVLLPDEPLALDANTRVRLTVEVLPPAPAVPTSFFATARSLSLDGPPDWSTRIDELLYPDPEDDRA